MANYRLVNSIVESNLNLMNSPRRLDDKLSYCFVGCCHVVEENLS